MTTRAHINSFNIKQRTADVIQNSCFYIGEATTTNNQRLIKLNFPLQHLIAVKHI